MHEAYNSSCTTKPIYYIYMRVYIILHQDKYYTIQLTSHTIYSNKEK